LLFKQKPADLLDRLMVEVCGHVEQSRWLKVQTPSEQVYTLRTEGRAGADNACDVCATLAPRLGKQRVICECDGKETEHEFSLDQSDLNTIENTLIDDDNDPAGLAQVKARAKANLPAGPFSRKVKVNYIRGGPGTGKSYIIRQLADERDLILSPLVALREDYINLTRDGTKERYNLDFATTHRAMEKVNKRRIFLDEFTLFDYKMLACIVHNTSAEEVFFVGDHEQTHIQVEHGAPIVERVDLSKFATHSLVVNFRNPVETVDVLNKHYGYNMVSASGVSSPIRWVNPKNFRIPEPKPEGLHYMAFTHREAQDNDIPWENTVKTSQGKTFDKVVLFLDQDTPVARSKSMQIVALSRHRVELTIVAPPALRAEIFPPEKFPDQGFPEERVTLDAVRPKLADITQADYDAEEGVVAIPAQPKPLLLAYTAKTFYVNKWTVYLLLKAVFHVSVELGNGGHILSSTLAIEPREAGRGSQGRSR
jgi:hypothetical protein